MESQRHHRLPIAICLIALLLPAVPGRAENGQPPPFDEPPTIVVDTGPDSVVIDSSVEGHESGVSGTGNQASGDGPQCYLREVPMSDWDEDMSMTFFYFRMRRAPYYVVCGNENRGIVWIEISLDEPGNGGGATANPRDIAMHLRDEMPIPHVRVQVNPERGLVGAESWFWIKGYSGSPVTDSTNAFGRLVEVEATVTRYEWTFGDGVTLTSETPGRAYPERSEVRHVYERSSAGLPEGYGIDVSFEFAVRYRVDGGAWIEIPGITRTTHADYPVRESQAVIER